MKAIGNQGEMDKFRDDFWGGIGRMPRAYGLGVQKVAKVKDGLGERELVLETRYLTTNVDKNMGGAAAFAAAVGHKGGNKSYVITPEHSSVLENLFAYVMGDPVGKHGNLDVWRRAMLQGFGSDGRTERRLVVTFLDDPTEKIQSPEDAWLRMMCFSKRELDPRVCTLDGAFAVLPDLHWTSRGPMLDEDIERYHRESAFGPLDPLTVYFKDRFPRYIDYLVPPNGTRGPGLALTRLGGWIGERVVFMAAGWSNFGTFVEGPNMVEGRVSAGVTVLSGADIGGGASILGTLSGGNTLRITVGENCLLGATSTTGFCPGRNTTVAAGLAVVDKMDVLDCRFSVQDPRTCKAAEFNGVENLLFIRTHRGVEVRVNRGKNSLNPALH